MPHDIRTDCICSGVGSYNIECPVGTDPHFVRACADPKSELYVKLEVVDHEPGDTHPVKLFVFELLNGTGSWEEVFGSREQAAAFMVGLRAGLSMLGQHFRLYHIPEHAHRRTTERTPS